jgi:hypothetical protein
MDLIDKETIRKEIERKQRIARYQWRPQSEQLCQELLDWLDTLPEQPTQEKEERLDSKKYVRQIVGNEVRYYEIVGKKNQIPTIEEIPSWSYRQTNGLENIIIDSE